MRFCEREGIGFLAYSPVGRRAAPQEAALAPGAPADRRAARRVAARGDHRLGAVAGPDRDPDSRRPVRRSRTDALTAARIVLDKTEMDAIDRAEFSRA